MKTVLIFTFLCALAGSLYAADNNLSYAPSGALEDRLREGIENTQQSIDFCAHSFDALDIENALEGARSRGVRLRAVILRHGNGDPFGALAKALMLKGFDVRLMNLKAGDEPVCGFIVFDDRVLVTGAYNWLAYRKRTIGNDILFHYSRSNIQAHKDTFYQLFTKAEAVPLAVIQAEARQEKAAVAPVAAAAAPTSAKQAVQDDIEEDEPDDKNSQKSVKEKPPKVFIDISLEELDIQVGRKSTFPRSKKNELWKKYKGKYIRGSGYLAYKGMGRVDWNRVGISNKRKQKNADVEVLFDWTLFDKVVSLREGRLITYTGRLVSRPMISAPFRLDDGDIE